MEDFFSQKKTKVYECKQCDYITSYIYDFNNHNNSINHLGKIGGNSEEKISQKNSQKSSKKYTCKTCHFSTNRPSHYQNHIKTNKHLSKNISIEPDETICPNCEKEYSCKWNLSRHQKLCKPKQIVDDEKKEQSLHFPISQETFLEFVKQSTEFQNILVQQNEEHKKQIIELAQKSSITNNMTNSINKQFNIQLFLNDQCKDAINIMDFVESLQVQVSDLEKTGEIGYINGITRICNNLR